MTTMHKSTKRIIPWLISGMVGLACTSHVLAYDAEVVRLVGHGESRPTANDRWTPSFVTQLLTAGSFVRTGESSQMALLLRDQTQLRLSQNSMIQIKDLSAGGEPTRIDLPKGRVWMQFKRPDGTSINAAKSQSPALTVQTPNATAAIRGTDWELKVDDDGSATLTVLSGVVDFYNDLGQVKVAANEQARVLPGQAPTKVLLTNAREHIQWVTAYQPQPARWSQNDPAFKDVSAHIDAGRFNEAQILMAKMPASVTKARLMADLALSQGDTETAINLLRPYPNDPLAQALAVRASLIAGNEQEAAGTLARAREKSPDNIELLLAAGDLARFQGSYQKAQNSFDQARTHDIKNSEAWFGLGRIENEKENVSQSRQNLNAALALNPSGPGYRGELGTLETFANEFAAADAAFAEALKITPDDYVALTGLGILRLKEGKPEEALQSLLKATVIEPHFSRAVLYTAVAYYQLGRHQQAKETFERAAQMDPNDPLPHVMLSVIANDALDYGSAIQSAQKAMDLMPYLRSLNQLLNTQKGNANLGYALSQAGLEEWAKTYAFDSYTPYWAGSPLFLADRYSGDFTKNSELYRGFITDPSVFGASNRFSTLVPVPGDYFGIQGTLGRGDLRSSVASITANGYHISPFPVSYYLNYERPWIRPEKEELRVDNNNWTLGLGARPTYDIGLFAFATTARINGSSNLFSKPDGGDTLQLDTDRIDLGAHYRISSTNMLWFKFGHSKEEGRIDGQYYDPAFARAIQQQTGLALNPYGNVRFFNNDFEQQEFQLRHTLDLTPDYQFSWGIEQATAKQPYEYRIDFLPLLIGGTRTDKSDTVDAYISNRLRLNEQWLAQADLGYQHLKRDNTQASLQGVSATGILNPTAYFADNRSIDTWMPRVGVAWSPLAHQTLRLAYQDWRRPASVSTLSSIDTVGIALDDQVTKIGGELQQWRIQYDLEASRQTFFQGFFEHQEIENPGGLNGSTALPNFAVSDLQRLRNRTPPMNQTVNFWEKTPDFQEGRINRAGLAANHLFSPTITGFARYRYSDGENTTSQFSGNAIPWLPKHWFQLGGNWLPLPRWQLSAMATYRTQRYIDEANLQPLSAGWQFGVQSYWESIDKRWSVQAVIDNINGDQKNSAYQGTLYGVQATYRF